MGPGVDPIVLALAVALTTRQPVGRIVGGESAAAPTARTSSASANRPREAMARQPRSKNRKG